MAAVDAAQFQQTDAFLASFLGPTRGATPRKPENEQQIAERARYHGLEGLLAENRTFAAAAPAAHDALFRLAAGQSVREPLQLGLLREICDAFATAEIDFLILKGTALAFLIYERPHHRPRCDTDIIVRPNQVTAATAVLETLGLQAPDLYAPHNQRPFTADRHGIQIEIDLHWRPANSEVVSRSHEFAELAGRRQRLDRLHPAAHAPANDLLLSFAIVHLRFERQHQQGDRLIWLLDLRRLADRMTLSDWERFTIRQERIGMSGAAVATLVAAEQALGPFVPNDVRARLATAPPGALSAYLSASELGRMWREIRCRRPAEAARYVRHVIFPAREWLNHKYGTAPDWKVPFLYARRAIGGIAKARDRS